MTFDKLIKIGINKISSQRVNNYLKYGDCICVIESAKGNIFIGINAKFSNFGYCAEQSAILNMISNNEFEIKKIVTISKVGDVVPPCGRCLEMISQTKNANQIDIAISKYASKKLNDIYPFDWKLINNYNYGMPKDNGDCYNLKRFIDAQNIWLQIAINEIKSRKKKNDWVLCIFPAYKNLATNVKTTYYVISSIDEARAFFANDILKANIIKAIEELLKLNTDNINDIVDSKDAIRIQSSMTLFYKCTNNEIFFNVLKKFYNCRLDEQTSLLIESEKNNAKYIK